MPGNVNPVYYPFSAVYGMEQAKEALLCAVSNPHIRSVLIRGPPGTGKTLVARSLGYPKGGVPALVAATATPYKFPETCLRAFGADVLRDPPPSFRDLERLPVAQKKVVDVEGIDQAVRDLF